jgi:cell division protease FtsH
MGRHPATLSVPPFAVQVAENTADIDEVPLAFDAGAAMDVVRGFLLGWLPILLLVALLYLMWRVVAMMPRTKPQEVRADSDSSVRWVDVAGADEAKEELREVVEFLREPQRFAALGARVPKGILLYGPPGTGKTLLAKAVAHESGAAFFSQSASSFVEMFAGVGASRIRKLFDTARKHAPAIVFIDELDAAGAKRSGNAFNREQDQTLNQLLVELDGFAADPGLVVIAASNRLDALDPALLRPGRFDRQVLVGVPDLRGRREILAVHTRGKPLAPGLDLEPIARQTAGLAGADLENITNEAAIRAGRAGRSRLEREDFDWAVERVVAGLQTKRVISEREKTVIAYHEAGHALVSHLLGDARSLAKVTIVPRGQALGYTLNLPEEDRYLRTREELLDDIRMLLGGRAAEQVAFGKVSTGAANDLERVTQLARAMVFEFGMGETVHARTMRADNYALSEETKRLRDEEQARICDACYADAVALVEEQRAALDRLAEALLDHETLDRHEVAELLAGVPVRSDESAAIGTLLSLFDQP